MSDKEDAKKWRLKQAEELLKLFEEDTGSPATSKEELAAWLSSALRRVRSREERQAPSKKGP